MRGDRTSSISKGPSHLGASFFVSYCNFRCFDSSHTLSPFLNGLAPCVICSIIVCLANLCAASASFLASCNLLSLSLFAGVFVFGYAMGIPIRSYPNWRK